MARYLFSRFQQALVLMLGISAVAFLLVHLTGDPAALMMPQGSTREQMEAFRHLMGFDRPLYVQYLDFLSHAVRGDFGTSLHHGQPALGLVVERMPATLELTVSAMLVSIAVALPAGVISALRRGSVLDNVTRTVVLLGQSAPTFWLGIMLIILFAVTLRVLPSFGRGGLDHLVLPSATLGLYLAATIARLLRSSMLDVLSTDYIRTARAKGLSERVVVYKHALKNASIPAVTIIGIHFGTLLGGAVVTEMVFAWPGMGRLAVQAIQNRDIPLIQAFVVVAAVLIVAVNFLVDVVYVYLDPRIRLD